MPFVTVVTLGAASAASDLISSVVKSNGGGKEDAAASDENNSKLVGIRELSDDDNNNNNQEERKDMDKKLSENDKDKEVTAAKPEKKKTRSFIGYPRSNNASNKRAEKILSRLTSKGTVSTSSLSLSFNFGNLAQSKRKSVSFIDLRSAEKAASSAASGSSNGRGGVRNQVNKNKNKLLALLDLSPSSSSSNNKPPKLSYTNSCAESGYGSPDGSGDDSASCRSSTSSRSSSSSTPVAPELLLLEEDEIGYLNSIGQRGKALSHTDLTSIARTIVEVEDHEDNDVEDDVDDDIVLPLPSETVTGNNSSSTTVISSSSASSSTISGIIPTDDIGPSAVSSIRFIPCHEDDYFPQVIEVNKPTPLHNGFTSTINISSACSASQLNLNGGNFSSLLNTPSPSVASFTSLGLAPSSSSTSNSSSSFFPSSYIPKLSGTVQGKTNIWKTWIRNKFNLNRNGKYTLEGSMTSLGPFNIKANKSLLVDCTPESEYSTKKLYVIRRLPNECSEFATSGGGGRTNGTSSPTEDDIIDDLDDNYNLFVKECLRTYSTPFLELGNPQDDDEEDADLRLIKEKFAEGRASSLSFGKHRLRLHQENGIVHSTSALNVPTSNSELGSIAGKKPYINNILTTSSSTSILNSDCPVVEGDVTDVGVNNSTNGSEDRSQSPTRPPPWFWSVSCQSRGIELDEAGIALEGRLSVVYKNESHGDRYIQVKWDEAEERFHFIAWSYEAGRDFICKVNLGEADPIWNQGDNKLEINSELILHSEQRRGLLRDLYTVAVELGCYDKSASLASSDNVIRARNLVHLFQRVDALGFIQNGRLWIKKRIKMDLAHDSNGIAHRSKPGNELSSRASTLSASTSVGVIGGSGCSLSSTYNKNISPSSNLTSHFTLRIDSVEFRLRTEGNSPVEPYYLSLALYDVKNGKKISEDFHSTVDMDGNIVGNKGGQFRVTEANDQIYAVLRVEKTLQATEWEAYLRGNPDGKTGSRISKCVTTSPLFTSEQRYRMPLCWSCRPLFRKCSPSSTPSSGGGLSSADYVIDTEANFTAFYKHEKSTEEDMLKLLADMKKPEKVGKLTAVPGVFKATVEPLLSSISKQEEKTSLVNVIEFPINSVDNFNKFLHLLYVYPINLNLNPVASKIRARNVLCRVYLRTEDDVEASPLEQQPGGGSIATYVLHHRSNPEWYTEIKLSLPVALDPRLHLLFQFFHISASFDTKNKTNKPIENVVGYSWIPLLNKYRFIGGEHILPVAATLPSGYLQIQPLGLGKGSQSHLCDEEVATDFTRSSPASQGGLPQLLNITRKNKRQTLVQYSGPDINWLDKCTLSVKLNLISTVWTKCGSLGAFFAHSEKYLNHINKLANSNSQHNLAARLSHCDDETTMKTIRALETMDLATLRDFFPTIINQICNIAGISRSVGTTALKFLIFAFHTLIEAGLESIIEQYVRLRFLSSVNNTAQDANNRKNRNGNVNISNKPMSEVLIDSWIDLFETGDGSTIASSLEHSRSIFSMLIKSFAVQGVEIQGPVEDSKLVKLIQLFTSEVVQRCQSDHEISRGANEYLVSFITSLLSIVEERHIVFSVINAYLACFGPGDSHKLQDFKFYMLQKLVEHPLFLELNSATGDEDHTRLENPVWARRHFLVATVMKQCRSGLGEVSNVRCLALKPIMAGLVRHEAADGQSKSTMWIPWLRVVCDNLHRVSSISGAYTHSSRCSSVSTVLSSTSSALVHAALSKSISGHNHEGHNHGAHCTGGSSNNSRESSGIFPAHLLHQSESARSSSLSLNVMSPPGVVNGGGGGLNGNASQNCSMMSINQIGATNGGTAPSGGGAGSTTGSGTGMGGAGSGGGGSGGDRGSVDRMSFGSISNCDYLDAISAIKMSNPAASIAPSIVSCGSGTETIVNENISNDSGDGQSIMTKEPSDEGDAETMVSSKPLSQSGATTDVDKSNVVLRRYDKLNEMETSQLLVSGLYLLKNMRKDGIKLFWTKSTPRERSSLLQMVHLACIHFTNARKNSTITRKKVVGILQIPTYNPPSPRTSLPNKKWSSLPSKTEGEGLDQFGKEKEGSSPNAAAQEQVRKGSSAAASDPLDPANDWKTLSTEATFVAVDTLSQLMSVCKGESNEMRDVIRTTLDVAKTSEDTRAMLEALDNLFKVDELASIVFAKGNEDLSYQLFCNLLNGFGTSYLVNACVLILAKLFLQDPMRTTTQSLLAISSLQLSRVFIHNFRKSLQVLERNLSINDRSSFVMSITENLSFIDVSEFDVGTTVTTPGGASAHSHSNTKLNGNGKHTSLLTCGGDDSTSGSGILKPKLSRTLSSAVDLSTRLSTIINSIWILKSCHNDYRFSELYLKLANYYSHFARGKLRIEAFDALKDEHISKKRFSEALLCELHAAARLARHTATPEVKRIMLGISKNLKDEFEEVEEWPEEEDNTEELIQRLESCVVLCLKAERYELMLEVYRILVDIQESLSDYAALEHSYNQMSKACSFIQNKRERFLGTYYRVALFKPKRAEDLTRPTEIYVYKEPNVTSLTEICGKVETSESAVIVSGDIDQLPEDDRVYATITHVIPLASESPRRKLWSEDFRRHQNIQRFSYDTPFAMKSQDKFSIDNKAAVHQQWKRRTTITTEYTFPAVVNRLKVVESAEENLSPIVVAIDDMQRRVNELRSELHSQDIKRIQLRLQGSVSVQVNQGPLAYARAFFERESEYPTHDMNRLKAIFRDFVECCGELLIKNKNLIQPEQIDYHAQLDSDYTRLCTVLSPFIGLPDQAMNRMSRISINSY